MLTRIKIADALREYEGDHEKEIQKFVDVLCDEIETEVLQLEGRIMGD